MRIEILPEFESWFLRLKDRAGRFRIQARIDRLELGNLGDFKSVGSGVFELRVDHGPGYRIYLARRGDELVILLCGGDKSSQSRDIEKAKRLAEGLA